MTICAASYPVRLLQLMPTEAKAQIRLECIWKIPLTTAVLSLLFFDLKGENDDEAG